MARRRQLPRRSPQWPSWGLAAILAATALAYFPALDNTFTNWDDQLYVTANPAVHELSPGSLKLIATEFRFENYQPLTLLSFALDHALWGLTPRPFILHNLLLHLLATGLAFALVRRLLQSPAAAGLAAALFGLHPMHVEAVAWISARKNVLSTALSLAAVLLFLHWRSLGGGRRLAAGVAAFAAASLAKAAAVTMCPVMVAADLLEGRRLRDYRTLLGILPFAVVGLVVGIVAVLAHASGAGELNPYLAPPELPVAGRVAVAGWAAMTYIQRLVLPLGLSAFYPWPVPLTGTRLFLLAVGGVAAICLIVVAAASFRRAPVVAFGIAFFALTIAPYLQLTVVGRAVMADRFVYPSSLGLALVAGRSVVAVGRRFPRTGNALVAGCAAWLCTLGLLTAVRCNVWQDSESLWSDTIAHTPDEAWMWLSRADARLSRGDVNGALSDLNRSLEIWPHYGDAAFTRALIWEGLANWDAALADYSLAIALNPRDSAALAGRGFVHLKRGELASALDNFDRSLRLKEEAQVRYNRGLARSAVGDPDGAAEDFGRAAELRPGWTDAEIALAAMQRTLGELDAARRVLDSILDRQPTNVLALGNRALVKLDQADLQGALDDAQVALSIQSRDPLARLVRARVLLALGRTAEGCAELARLSAEGRSEAQAILADRCAGG